MAHNFVDFHDEIWVKIKVAAIVKIKIKNHQIFSWSKILVALSEKYCHYAHFTDEWNDGERISHLNRP